MVLASCQGSRVPALWSKHIGPGALPAGRFVILRALVLARSSFLTELSLVPGTVLYPGDSFRSARLESRSWSWGQDLHPWALSTKGGTGWWLEVDEEPTLKSVFSLSHAECGCRISTLAGKPRKDGSQVGNKYIRSYGVIWSGGSSRIEEILDSFVSSPYSVTKKFQAYETDVDTGYLYGSKRQNKEPEFEDRESCLFLLW